MIRPSPPGSTSAKRRRARSATARETRRSRSSSRRTRPPGGCAWCSSSSTARPTPPGAERLRRKEVFAARGACYAQAMTARGRSASLLGSKEGGFYLRHLVEGEVLVLGAGPGTVALGLARAGRSVLAIEPSEWMRQVALATRDRLGTPLQKACTIEGGDLFSLSLGRVFPNVIAPGF